MIGVLAAMTVLNTDKTTASAFEAPAVMGDRLYEGLKRSVDIAGALVGLAIAAPICLLAAAIIRCCDGGPVLMGQWRLRHGGRLFRMYKFRTMYRNAERASGAVTAQRVDPRIIPACRWMRLAHVDELPQLWNVLRGEMSLVGPRPERPEIAFNLRDDIEQFGARTAVKPGLTGLAQVSQGYANDVDGFRKKLRYDLAYVRMRSIRTDLKLLLATVRKFWDRAAH